MLIGRSKFPSKDEWEKIISDCGSEHGLSKKIIRLQQIENAGATIYVEQADVKDFGALKSINPVRY